MDAPLTLIPVNQLDRAKGRLSTLLDARQRAELALVTLTTAWHAALEVSSAVVILTADLRIHSLLGPRAVVLRESPDAHGLNEQLALATTTLIQERKLREDACLLILHADLPLATPPAIHALFAAAPPPPSATIVRSADGGTNAMLQCPPGKLALAYGLGSAAKHEAAARNAGMTVAWHESPELALDLDTPADIATLLNLPAGWNSPAGRTLATMGIRERLGLPR